jgi:hypothetical protein
MSVSGVGAIGGISSGTSVYALLSPYLNGVVRTSDAATAAQVDATSQITNSAVAQAAIAAEGDATAAVTALPPFANPAITAIGQRIALGQSLNTTVGVTPDALLSSTTLDGNTNSNALNTIANLTSLDTFNSIDSLNSVASLNSLSAFDSLDSLTTATTASAVTSSPPPAPDQLSATNSVLTGDTGLLVQSYGAVALLAGVAANASILAQAAATPLIPAPATVTPVPSVNAVA